MSDLAHKFAGKWITDAEFADREPINVFHRQLEKVEFPKDLPQNRHILFRREFELDEVHGARIFISADDYYKLYINGRFVTQGPCPGYIFHYYYNELDVSPYLKPGRNVIAVHTYYQGLINRVWVSGDMRHGLIFDLTNGGKTVLCSDESVLVHAHTGYSACGITGYQTQFMERYDSRAPEARFMAVDFDASAWGGARIRKFADYELFPQPTRQLQLDEIAPVSINETDGGLILDFGSIYVGYFRAKAQGAPGEELRLLFGQELSADGHVRHAMRCNCDYSEEWVLSGGEDELNPFDYKSFRYVEILNPGGARLGDMRITARHYPFELKAEPNTDDPELRAIWDLCVNSLHWGVQDVIQDCMDREKGQYLGDGCFSSVTLAVMTRDASILKKLVDDSLRSAFVNKGLMTCTTCSMMQEIAEYPLMMPLAVLFYLQLTGDSVTAGEWYPKIVDMLEFFRASYEREDGLLYDLDKWCLVEWPKEYRDGYDYDLTEGQICRGTHNVINAYYIGAIKMVNALAQKLGRPIYRDTAGLTTAFNAAFYDRGRHAYRDSRESEHVSLPSNILPALYSLSDDPESADTLLDMIREKRLSRTNFFMTYPMFMALTRMGRRDIVLELIHDQGGWLRMLREGATVTMEGWGRDCKWNTSLFHLAFTYPVLWMTEWGMDEALRSF